MEVGDKGLAPSSSSSSSSWLMGSRQRFNIELRPGETTIVSWKRLVKDTINNPSQSLETPLTVQKAQVPLDDHIEDNKLTAGQNGCIVDNGSVEHINEPVSSANCQLKKRRKNTAKLIEENGDDHLSNKCAKMDLIGAGRMSQTLATCSERRSDVKSEHPLDSPIEFSAKDGADTSIKLEYSSALGVPNRDASVFQSSKDKEKQGTGTITYGREPGNPVNFATELSGATHKKYQDKNASKHLEQQAKRLMEEITELEFSSKVSMREKTETNELPDLNIPAEPVPVPVQPMKTASMTSKDVSGLRPKGTMLERAIRELEKVVAESRPSNMDLNDADTSSVAIKKRLPGEVKLKLAKVARLAQSSQGKISEELINRLMSILGHLMQLRTLKRNLREMVLRGLSAKREKADRFQQIKKEVIEMIELQGAKQGAGEIGTEQKGLLTQKFVVDNATGDKLCDLYDLYVQGMDEDKGPQIRKLYVELVELWPNGAMDKHQIKDAIRRAKERRRALYDHQTVCEKVRKKKSTPRLDIGCGEPSSGALPQAELERLITQSNSNNSASPDKMICSVATGHQHLTTAISMSTSLFIDSSINLHKQEIVTFPMLKEQIKQQQRELNNKVKKLSLKHERESHKSHRPGVTHPDDFSSQFASSPANNGRPE